MTSPHLILHVIMLSSILNENAVLEVPHERLLFTLPGFGLKIINNFSSH